MSSADTDEKTDAYEIPDSSRGFVNIANISSLDMLKVKGNHNCITTDPEFIDEDDDGFDDRDEYAGGHKLCPEFVEAVAGFVANVIRDLICGSSLDSKMNDRADERLLSRSFNYHGLIATPEQQQAFEESGRRLEDAIARAKATPDTESFLNLCDARMERKIAGTDLIMNNAAAHGDTAAYNEAKAHNDRFHAIRHDIGVLQQRMSKEPDEAKKQAEIKAIMPGMWDRFQKGELTTEDGGMFNAWRSSKNPDEGITQPFWNTLSGLFRLAGFQLPVGETAPANSDQRPAFQPS